MKETDNSLIRTSMQETDVDGSSRRPLPQIAPRKGIVRRIFIGLGIVLLILFWLAALPLPGPLSRAREAYWKASDERYARVQSYEKNGRPDDKYAQDNQTIVLEQASGSLNLKAETCESGQRRMFYGVTIEDASQPGTFARIVLPEDGSSHITIAQQGREELVFPKKSCPLWDVAVEPNHVIANGVRGLHGHAISQCSTQSASIKGQITFRSCS